MELSKEQIDKYRRIYKETTNETAKATAKQKLEEAGIALSEEAAAEPKEKEKPVKEVSEKKAKVKKTPKQKVKKEPKSKVSKTHETSDGFKFKIVSKAFAEKNWKTKEIYGIDKATDSEALIESKKDLNRFEIFGTEIGKTTKKEKTTAKKSAPDYDCNDLKKEAEERFAKREAIKEKKKNEPKKTPATKNKEVVVKLAKELLLMLKNVQIKEKLTQTKSTESLNNMKKQLLI